MEIAEDSTHSNHQSKIKSWHNPASGTDGRTEDVFAGPITDGIFLCLYSLSTLIVVYKYLVVG
jgi:hypothetical protein